MVSFKISFAFIFFTSLALFHFSFAQNSPQNYLYAHNVARRQVGVGPMKWSTTLANYAQNYVNSHKDDCHLVHSGSPYGENLAKGSGTYSAAYAVSLWVNEKPYYNYNSNKCVGGECGHYTQVVWRKSEYIGCAMARCYNGYWYMSCNYYPAGNVRGQWPY